MCSAGNEARQCVCHRCAISRLGIQAVQMQRQPFAALCFGLTGWAVGVDLEPSECSRIDERRNRKRTNVGRWLLLSVESALLPCRKSFIPKVL